MSSYTRTRLPIIATIGWSALIWSLAGCAHSPGEATDPSGLAADTWYFRGTPNNWATTALTPVAGTSSHETCQAFGTATGQRFKIDHFGDWAESYPAQDYGVSSNDCHSRGGRTS